MNALLGIIFHSIGGFASGSFYLPYKKVSGWAWETMWLLGGLVSWLIAPIVAAAITIPNFLDIIKNAETSVLLRCYIFGVLWGIGGLTFGLSMRYLGMSLGMSVALGFCSAFGALGSSVYREFNPKVGEISISSMFDSDAGQITLLSILVCLIGIGICGYAGMRKEKDLPGDSKTETVKEFNLTKGLLVATFSGILSACFSFGIEAGAPMAKVAENAAKASGSVTLFKNNVTFVVVLLGGLTTNFIWCIYLNYKNKTFGDYKKWDANFKRNLLFAALAGLTWYLQFFFYGMGEDKLGNSAGSWILHMATIIITSNLWGIYHKEWKGVTKSTFNTLLVGVGVIVVSVVLAGVAKT